MSLKLANLRPSFLVRKNRNPTIDCNKQIKSCPCFKRWEKRQNEAYFYINNKEKHNPDESYQQFINEGSNYNIIDLNDDFMHIIMFHIDREAVKIEKNCSLLSCRSILINYREPNMLNDRIYFTNNNNIAQKEGFNRQKIFIEDRHSQHEQIYHHNKSLKEIRSIITRYSYYDKLISRYVHNRNNIDTADNKHDEKQNDDELQLYETGELFNFSNKRSSSYIWCKFENLKAEWFGFPKFDVECWDEKILKAQDMTKSKFIKKNFVSIDGNPMSAVRILTIHEYTANDALQRAVCRVSRKTMDNFNGSQKQLKRAQGAFGHTYKLLMDTIELFGKNIKDNDEYTILYRGIDNICKFNSATISCYTPTSTTTSRRVAASFAEGIGCILELHQHAVLDGYYLSLKELSRFPLEEEWLFYGKHSHLFVMYIGHPIIENNSYYFGSIALIEDLISDPNDSMKKLKRKIKKEKKGKKDDKNRKLSATKSMTKLISKPTKQRMRAMEKYDIYSDQSIEDLIKLLRKYIKYDALKKRKYSASNPRCIGSKDSVETNEIQMIQFHHIICKKKRICFRDNTLIECMNEAFAFKDEKVRISNIVDIFPNVGEIVFKYKVDQSSIIDYCLNDNTLKGGLYKITIHNKLQHAFKRLSDKFNNNTEWEIFTKKNKVIWQKSIEVTDSD